MEYKTAQKIIHLIYRFKTYVQSASQTTHMIIFPDVGRIWNHKQKNVNNVRLSPCKNHRWMDADQSSKKVGRSPADTGTLVCYTALPPLSIVTTARVVISPSQKN